MQINYPEKADNAGILNYFAEVFIGIAVTKTTTIKCKIHTPVEQSHLVRRRQCYT